MILSNYLQNCHHQITYCNLDLIIEYPPPYERFVWDCKRANVSALNAALNFLFLMEL